MTAVALALASSLAYGASDYVSGQLTTRLPAAAVVLVTASLQSLLMLVVVAWVGEPVSGLGLGAGAAGGFIAALALILYYRALALGPAGIVAPIAAVSSALPVLASLVVGAALGLATLAGLVAVLAGLVVLTRSAASGDAASDGRAQPTVRPVTLAFLAALCFGLAFLLIDAGTDSAPESTLWVLCGVQLGAVPMPWLYTRLVDGRRALSLTQARSAWWPLLWVTALNMAADAALIVALRDGPVGVISVMSSLAPAVTIGLGQFVARERLTRAQAVGAALTFLGTLVVVGSTG